MLFPWKGTFTLTPGMGGGNPTNPPQINIFLFKIYFEILILYYICIVYTFISFVYFTRMSCSFQVQPRFTYSYITQILATSFLYRGDERTSQKV